MLKLRKSYSGKHEQYISNSWRHWYPFSWLGGFTDGSWMDMLKDIRERWAKFVHRVDRFARKYKFIAVSVALVLTKTFLATWKYLLDPFVELEEQPFGGIAEWHIQEQYQPNRGVRKKLTENSP